MKLGAISIAALSITKSVPCRVRHLSLPFNGFAGWYSKALREEKSSTNHLKSSEDLERKGARSDVYPPFDWGTKQCSVL